MLRRIYIVTLAFVLSGILETSGQQRSVIAGLEENTEYRALIDRERALVKSADSLAAEISTLRNRLRADTLGRVANSAAIKRMEEQGFDVRSRMARLASRINTIEQEWILADLAGGRQTDSVPSGNAVGNERVPEGYLSRNLIYSTYFSETLSSGELAELHGAQRAESDLPPLVERYSENHAELQALADQYERVGVPSEADSLERLFRDRAATGEATERRIGERWGSIFDSKSYLYNLLADKQNRSDLLESFERGMERIREERSRHTEEPAALVNYVLQKRMLTDYELTLAEDTGNRLAVDSLRAAATTLLTPESLSEFAPVVLKERLFLDYSDITIGGSPYNASNPIPEVAVWSKGVIWRVHIGNFSARQSPAVFRGAHPLAVQTGEDKRFKYFAGGFPTDSLVSAAVEQLRKAGFRAPKAVVWMDGIYVDPEEAVEKIYRIEISGVEELSTEMRELTASADGIDIVRGDGLFILTPLDGLSAVRLRTGIESLRAAHPEMGVRLSKNSE